MSISLEDRAPKIPGVQFKEPGQTVKMHLVDRAVTEYRQFTSDGSVGAIARKDDGTPKKQLVYTGITVPLKPDETPAYVNDQPIQPGQLVRVYIKGSSYGQHIEQAKALDFPAAEVGDRFAQQYVRAEPGKGAQPKKIYVFGHRRAKPEEAAVVAECAAKHSELRAAPAIPLDGTSSAPAQAPVASGVTADDLLD